MMIRLLCVSHSVDIINYNMLYAMGQEQIEVYATYTSEEEKNILQDKCVALKIPYFRSKFKYAAIKAVRSIVKKYNIDVIYALNSADLSIALFATWGTKAQVVGYRGTQARIRKIDPTYYLATLNPRVAHTMCATADIKEQLSKFISPEKMTVNPKPYDVRWMDHVMKHPKNVEGIPENAFQVICLANTKRRPFKGLRVLISAMQLLNEHDIHLIHIGDYDEADFQLAKSGPNALQMHFLGKRKDAIYFLPGKDVCICPSTRDASPRSLREAMACKVACIVTDIPGARELVVNGSTGMIVPPEKPEAMAEMISYLALHRETTIKYGEAGYQRIITEYTLEKYVQNLKKVFFKVLKNEDSII